MAPEDEDRVERWEHTTAYPLTVLSLLFIVVYAWPILDPSMEVHRRRTCEIADLVIWILFGIDFLARFSLARREKIIPAYPLVRSHRPAAPVSAAVAGAPIDQRTSNDQ